MGKGRKNASTGREIEAGRGYVDIRRNISKSGFARCTPSEPWVEEQMVHASDIGCRRKPSRLLYHNPRGFPPGGEQS